MEERLVAIGVCLICSSDTEPYAFGFDLRPVRLSHNANGRTVGPCVCSVDAAGQSGLLIKTTKLRSPLMTRICFVGVVGYHDRFTRGRSRVRTSYETFCLIIIIPSQSMLDTRLFTPCLPVVVVFLLDESLELK